MNINNTRISIVEDDPFFLNIIKGQLESQNFNQIDTYESGESFLAKIHDAPDVVILDYSLGEMNGLEVLKKIRSINPDIQVIMLSAQEKMTVAIDSLKFGAYDYLEKTNEGLVRLGNLIKRIAQLKDLVQERKQYRRLAITFMSSLGLLLSGLIYLYIHST